MCNLYFSEFHYSLMSDLSLIRFIGKVSDIPASFKPKRCGGILVGNHQGNLLFGFAIDEKTREITDFSGRLKRKEGILECAMREIKEETLGLVGLKLSELQNYLCICDNENLSIFIPIRRDPLDFYAKYITEAKCFVCKNGFQPENFTTTWFSKENLFIKLQDQRRNRQWYFKTREFLLSFPYYALLLPHISSHFITFEQS
jgi:hypothetical protein